MQKMKNAYEYKAKKDLHEHIVTLKPPKEASSLSNTLTYV